MLFAEPLHAFNEANQHKFTIFLRVDSLNNIHKIAVIVVQATRHLIMARELPKLLTVFFFNFICHVLVYYFFFCRFKPESSS